MLRKLALLASLLMVSVSAFAQTTPAPELISFQGKLVTPSGNPVEDGTYSIRFSLWSAATGGTEKWFQLMNPVMVKNGGFAVLLGNGIPISADIVNGDTYLEIKVGNDAPLSPRQQLVSVAYALKANTVPDNAITTPKIADGAVTDAKIQSVDWSKLVRIPPSLLTLPYSGTLATGAIAFRITNNHSSDAVAIYGDAPNGHGVEGRSNISAGVVGRSNVVGVTGENLLSGNYAYIGTGSYGVQGVGINGTGVYGSGSLEGVRAASGPGTAVFAYTETGTGILGKHNGTGNFGVIGTSDAAIYGKGYNGFAGQFDGVVQINGSGSLLRFTPYGSYNYIQSGATESGSAVDLVFAGTNGSEFVWFKANGNVGIGTGTPTAKLDVNGTTRMTGLQLTTGATAGRVLTSDAGGNATWQALPPGVPSGAIMMWSGSTAPTGWALCDGTNGTPDLRDRFVVGAGGSLAGPTGGSGSHSHTVSGHTHSVSVPISTTSSNGLHSHSYFVDLDYNTGYDYTPGTGHSFRFITSLYAQFDYTSGEGNHTHTVPSQLLTTGSATSTTNSTGHLPPYYKLAFIMKL